jgi:hypothetical protein
LDVKYPDIQPFYKKIFSAAIKDSEIQEDIEFVRTFFEEWSGNFLHPLADEFMHQEREKTTLFNYLNSECLTFDWIGHSLLFANYSTVIRELQSILYKAIMVYPFDSPEKDLVIKVNGFEEGIENNKRTIKEVFEQSGYSDWLSAYSLYESLNREATELFCAGTMALVDSEPKEFTYNRANFQKCCKLWKELARILVSLAIENAKTAGLQFWETNEAYRIWQ